MPGNSTHSRSTQSWCVANTLSAAGQHTRAIEELNKALKMAPRRADVPFQLGATYVLKGDIKAAIPEFEKAVALSTQRNPRFRAYLGYAYAIDGRTRESQQVLQELLALRDRQYVSSFGIALIHDALGDKAATLTALERAFQEHAFEFVQLDSVPAVQNARVRAAVSGTDPALWCEPLNNHSFGADNGSCARRSRCSIR